MISVLAAANLEHTYRADLFSKNQVIKKCSNEIEIMKCRTIAARMICRELDFENRLWTVFRVRFILA